GSVEVSPTTHRPAWSTPAPLMLVTMNPAAAPAITSALIPRTAAETLPMRRSAGGDPSALSIDINPATGRRAAACPGHSTMDSCPQCSSPPRTRMRIARSCVSSVARGRAKDLPRVGACALLFTDVTPLRYLNYGIPDDGADPDDADVAALVAAFRAAD